ncbi:MAG: hypothetical protein A2745_03265 [Candidatus Harrisonbacteria bacterium RIFCSPHIGHO2_01_FULL_44_13]|uniref:Four helix bundle protein n=1 Tax=Candidatus Harrisonbacteria bacterium RIFCSPLOWO2_01_FULL_44_18 TaxID=1798407 RepID=A0A1G1ZLU4_9BACT|nr:MAG: hypothetical protein A2745_03265 [Candidatus Harrisonbacteria bacterium RIFCSPHIGHO2_01_FULL_44_13]OGY65409.1 MAG: hypothetical protein A3A16_03115 [Candidatus Harrisonbacteria bacterium RIFCSPLOWO2_01_FULL_44_18]
MTIKIDSLLIDTLSLFFTASRLNKNRKLPLLNSASEKIDLLKFFLQFIWELKVLDNKKYILLSKDVIVVGKMLGNWIKSVEKQTLPK